MIGELIVKAIPWIIPAILFCSWVSNWNDDPAPPKGKKEDKPVEPPKTEETQQ